ncbi:MAG: 30S ribosomal protein S9 [Candidatus Levybacteria bacterium]|nr:30S ribosomal protein S9 [Candidatus Levybacteria bacterium]
MVNEEKKIQEKTTKPKNKKEYIATVGRRRDAVARVRLYATVKEGLMFGGEAVTKGMILVNEIPAEKYFSGEVAKVSFMEPFRVTNTIGRFAVTVKVSGGGKAGQLGAFIHGASRALSVFDTEKFRKILKKKGFLTRDSRTRERRKVGTGGKARRKKQSPKR